MEEVQQVFAPQWNLQDILRLLSCLQSWEAIRVIEAVPENQ